MPKPVMPSGAMKNAKLLRRKTQGSGSVSLNAVTESLFPAKLSSISVKALALTRAPENEGENQDISLETTFTLSLAGHMTCFFWCFCL